MIGLLKKSRRRRGTIMILFVLFAAVVFGASALAFDLVYAYTIKSILQTSVDAAVLAGLRATGRGPRAINNAVDRTFRVNYPDKLMWTKTRAHTTPTVETITGGKRISVTGTATIPTFFAGWFGRETLDVSARAMGIRRDRIIVLVLDYSSSLEDELDQVKQAAKAFVDDFDDQQDQVGLVTFSDSSRIDVAPRYNFKVSVKAQIDNIQTLQGTNSTLALWKAYQALLDVKDPMKGDKLNTIVFFTDGIATAFPGTFNVSTAPPPNGCATSPVSAARHRLKTKMMKLTAPVAPVVSVPPIPQCATVPEGTDVVQSIEETWYPDATNYPSVGVSIHGINGPAITSGAGVMSVANVTDIAENMQVNIGEIIRNDTILNIYLHTIGFGGADPTILKMLSNTEDSATYNPNQQTGMFVFADSANELMAAFREVASTVGRLTQ